MRAVVYDAFTGPLRVTDLDEPPVPPHGARIKVEATGLCRSDWHGWMGHDPDIVRFPHVPGHELAGVVVEVGTDVTHWQPGARVTVPFVCACGACEECATGQAQVCRNQTQPGFHNWGSFADTVVIDHADTNLVRLPDDLPFEAAAGLGCRVATAYRAVAEVARARQSEWVAVHGCGGVGLSAVMVARALGARVVAVDPGEEARALALRFGAEAALEPGASIVDATEGGAHVSLDCVGGPEIVRASLAGLRRRGRHVQVGILAAEASVPVDRVMGWELSLLGSHGLAAASYPALLGLVSSGALPVQDLVTREIGLDELPEALPAVGTGAAAGVTIIRPG